MKKKPVIIATVAVAVVASLVVVNLKQDRVKKVEVETEKVALRGIKEVVTASGSISPKQQVDVSANRMGTITNIAVEEGEWVEEGDFLLQIDPIQYAQTVEQYRAGIAATRAELEQAAVTLNQNKKELERIRGLREQDFASPKDLLNAETVYEVALARRKTLLARVREQQASLKRGEHDLELSTILAPMSGVITRLNVEKGETAVVGTMNQPGTVLLTVSDLSELEAEVEVNETDVIDIRLGQEAVVSIDSYPDTTFGGKVTEVGNSAIRGNRQTESVDFKVVITLDDPIEGAKPGLSATADIIIHERSSVLSVPIQSLTIRARKDSTDGEKEEAEDDEEVLDDDPTLKRKRDEREGVFVVRENRAVFVIVETGIAGDEYFEVLSGLSEGDPVVTGDFKAIRTLEDNDPVKIAK